tara:strand:+ start:670 stop:999 length:330 start_codon:yes stop_codon:yes gene_type:complete
MGRRKPHQSATTGQLSKKQLKLLYEVDLNGLTLDLLAKHRHKGTSSATVNALVSKGMIRCTADAALVFDVREYQITQKGKATLETDMRKKEKSSMLRDLEESSEHNATY